MKKILLVLIVSAFACQNSFADEELKTELERFSSETGIVTIMGYEQVQRISALGGSIEIQKREVKNPNSPETKKGMLIKINRDRGTGSAFIDNNEIDGLIEGIEYISKVTSDVTSLKNFEISYVTNGGLKLTVFNGSDGSLSTAVQAGSYQVFPEFSELPKLLEAIKKARH